MASTPRSIDMQNHPRRAQFEYFSQMANPYVGVTVNVDLSALCGMAFQDGRAILPEPALRRIPRRQRRAGTAAQDTARWPRGRIRLVPQLAHRAQDR